MANILDQTIRLTNAKLYVEYWDSFISQDWLQTKNDMEALGMDFCWVSGKPTKDASFAYSGWMIFPRQSWKILPKPYFGNTCLNNFDSLKGVFINLNPKCNKEDELSFDKESYISSLPYYAKDIYRSGRGYSKYVEFILKEKHDDLTFNWNKKKRANWLSELLLSKPDSIANNRILTMEICPWHSSSWTNIEKEYILQHPHLIYNKIITPAAFYSTQKISPLDFLNSSVICYGADIAHLFQTLINQKIGNIQKVNSSAIIGNNNFMCNVFLVNDENNDKIEKSLFFVFQSKGLGVNLPNPSIKQTFLIPGTKAERTVTELITYYKEIALLK